MAEADMETPLPPKPSDYEEKKGESTEKKGFLKRVFGKKKQEAEETKPVKEPEKTSEEKKPKKSEEDLDEISKLIDDTINDIQQLQTKNTKQEPKESESPKKEPEKKVDTQAKESEGPKKEPEEKIEKETKELPITSSEEVKEPPKIEIATKEPEPPKAAMPAETKKQPVKQEIKKPEVKKPVQKPVTKPAKKVAVKKPVKKKAKQTKKAAVKKPVIKPKQPAKTTKKSSSYSLPGFSPAKTQKKSPSAPSLDLDSQISSLQKELNNIPVTKNQKAKNAFLMQDGTKINSLTELSKALDNISDDVWNHHVNTNKNDFASWIKSELSNPSLASKIRTFLQKKDAARVLKEEIQKIPKNEERRKKITAELHKKQQEKQRQEKQKKLSAKPQEFFKVDKKISQDIASLQKALTDITSHEFSAYVTRNKAEFQKWLTYLTRDYQKQVNEFKKKYTNLSNQIISGVNGKVDKKISSAKKELQTIAKKQESLKKDVNKLSADKTKMLKEQKELSAKKRNLLAEVAKVKKEHKQVHELREKTKKEKDTLHNEIQKAQQELKQQKKKLDQQTRDAKKTLREEEKRHKHALADAKKEAKTELTSLNKQIKEVHKQVEKEEQKLKKDYAAFDKKKQEIQSRDEQSKKREAAVQKREDAFESEKLRIETLVKNFEEREKEIELKKSELEVAGFQKYLEGKLSEIQSSDASPGTFDAGIAQARDMIKQNDVDGAKRKYLDMKSEFESSGLSGAEKDRVFNLLRELYDDIMLSVNS